MTKEQSAYKQFVRNLAAHSINRTFLNSDEDHALSVLIELFQAAKKTIRIFAGNLSDSIGNRMEYIVALSEFIERDGEVYIMLNNFDEQKAKESNLFKRLSYYQSINKPVHVKLTSERPYRIGPNGEKIEAHFTVGDDRSYRVETDIEKRTAECNMNNPNVAKLLAAFYDKLYDKVNNEYELNKLFENNDK